MLPLYFDEDVREFMTRTWWDILQLDATCTQVVGFLELYKNSTHFRTLSRQDRNDFLALEVRVHQLLPDYLIGKDMPVEVAPLIDKFFNKGVCSDD